MCNYNIINVSTLSNTTTDISIQGSNGMFATYYALPGTSTGPAMLSTRPYATGASGFYIGYSENLTRNPYISGDNSSAFNGLLSMGGNYMAIRGNTQLSLTASNQFQLYNSNGTQISQSGTYNGIAGSAGQGQLHLDTRGHLYWTPQTTMVSVQLDNPVTLIQITSTINNLTIPYSNVSLATAFQLYASSNELFFGTMYPPKSGSGTSAQIFIGDVKVATGNSNNTEPILLMNQPPIANYLAAGVTVFTVTGGDQSYTVPAGVTSLTVEIAGAQGGSDMSGGGGLGGYGDIITGTLAVTPGETLTVIVGSNGLTNYGGTYYAVSTFGGGAPANAGNNYFGGAGGGRSAIRRGATELATAGGGGGSSYQSAGGRGAYATGYQGYLGTTPGTQSTGSNVHAGGGGGSNTGGQGGKTSGQGLGGTGSQYLGGSNSYNSVTGIVGGGGGGGYYGGGGGTGFSIGAAGGGGSSYIGGLTSASSTGSNGSATSNAPEPGYVAFSNDTVFLNRRNGNMLELRAYNGLSTILDGNTVTAVTSSNTMIQSSGMFISMVTGSGITILNSSDGTNWSNVAINAFDTHGYAIAYNGTMWVAGGTNTSGFDCLKYSYNGINWYNAASSPAQFASYVNGVAWGNNMWLAFGATIGGSYGTTIKYSYDGIVWNDVTSGSFANDSPTAGYWNGKMWVAVGQYNYTYNPTMIIYSYDGLTWSNATYAGSGSPSTEQNGIAWNGNVWVSNGQLLVYSYDGITWYDCYPSNTSQGWGVCWNGTMFLTGRDDPSYYTLQYSYDGITWYPIYLSPFVSVVYGIAWNGSLWVINAYYSGGTAGYIFKSTDGFTWYQDTISGSIVDTFMIAYNLSTTPIYSQKTLRVISADKGYYPLLNTPINQVTFSQSTITLDNTKLGINRTPTFTLDVNGSANFSSIVAGFYDTSNAPPQTYLLSLYSGDAFKPSGTSWNVASDQRIKENIVDADLTRCYDDLKHLSLRRFNYISSFSDQVKLYDNNVTGFIAQEIISTIPKAVKQMSAYGYSDFKTINLDQITMTSFGAIKKLITDKESLESTVVTLQTMNDTLQLRLSTLEGIVSSKL
jgi:hypothetical protein